MKKTLKNIVIGATIVGAIMVSGCKKTNTKAIKNNHIPTPSKNQSIILHPDYLAGKSTLGYTLLTDLDLDGRWDLAEIQRNDLKKAYFKKGYTASQSEESIKFVDKNFFNPYQ